jgi:hypothetical protein
LFDFLQIGFSIIEELVIGRHVVKDNGVLKIETLKHGDGLLHSVLQLKEVRKLKPVLLG